MSHYRSPLNIPRPPKKPSPMTEVTAFVSHDVFKILKSASEKMEIPVSRLIAQAIDNELDAPSPFNFPCPMPTIPFVEGAYSGEAQKIYDFLRKYSNGVDVETLMLCRRDIGILSRQVLMLALREFLNTSLAEVFSPKRTIFRYARDYTRIRIKPTDPRDLKKRNRYKNPSDLAGDDDE